AGFLCRREQEQHGALGSQLLPCERLRDLEQQRYTAGVVICAVIDRVAIDGGSDPEMIIVRRVDDGLCASLRVHASHYASDVAGLESARTAASAQLHDELGCDRLEIATRGAHVVL